jgi:hypothetical protein
MNMTLTKSQRDLRTFMTIAQEQAIAEAKLMPTTPDIKRRAHAIAEAARDRLAEMQREERAKRPTNVVSGKIRDAIKKMPLPDVMAWLDKLRAQHPTMQIAHRDYRLLSETDARSALEDAWSLTESEE